MVLSVTKLDDFLGPLHAGVWEVIIPKESVTEPLDPGWERSSLNLPSPGTIASFRKGQYHAHEQKTEWHVHLDNYDPKTHPLLHLIDDAPLLLMIGDTFYALITDTRKKTGSEEKILEAQRRAWKEQVLAGVLLMLVGLRIVLNPLVTFVNITSILIPLAIICLGLLSIWKGISLRPLAIRPRGLFYRGIGVVFLGVVAYYLALAWWVLAVLSVLAFWMFASAVVLLARARKGRAAIPEGFVSRVAIAIVSLVLAAFIFVNPAGILQFLMEVLGVLAFLAGLMLFVNGFRLRERMAMG